MHESCHTYECVMSHVWMSHVTYMHESHHTYEWIMSHIWISQRIMSHPHTCYNDTATVSTNTRLSHAKMSPRTTYTHTHTHTHTHVIKTRQRCQSTEGCHAYEWLNESCHTPHTHIPHTHTNHTHTISRHSNRQRVVRHVNESTSHVTHTHAIKAQQRCQPAQDCHAHEWVHEQYHTHTQTHIHVIKTRQWCPSAEVSHIWIIQWVMTHTHTHTRYKDTATNRGLSHVQMI